MVLVLLFAVHGFFRGLLVQVFGAAGVLLGIWLATVVLDWVGARWAGAHPVALLWALKWVVAVLGGLTLASLLTIAAEAARHALHATPLGWVDRMAGVAAGLVLTCVAGCFAFLLALQLPAPRALHSAVREARCSAPILALGESLCTSVPWFPGAAWLRVRFQSAARRIVEAPHRT